MTYALYITHPEVVIDPAVPMPRWGLSPKGRGRAEAFSRHPLVARLSRIVSSEETKALELAQILAAPYGTPVEKRGKLRGKRSFRNWLPAGRKIRGDGRRLLQRGGCVGQRLEDGSRDAAPHR